MVVAFLLGSAGLATADQRLVRVIWDPGHGGVYYRADTLIQLGQDGFVVPADVAAAKHDGFTVAGRYSLRVDDVVRIYVVNYSPVSHVWDQSSTDANRAVGYTGQWIGLSKKCSRRRLRGLELLHNRELV